MDITRFGFGYGGEVRSGFEQALQRTKEALASQGFGVQAEIDISNALKSKLGVNMPREVILGVCNPALAHRAMLTEPHVTVLLPCNVTVKEVPGGTHIATASPQMLVEATRNPALADVASAADALLMQAFAQL